jgi:signal transduction histidine kinase
MVMDMTVDRQHPPPAKRRHRRVPWSPRAWGEAFYLAAAIPAQLLGGLIFLGMIRWGQVMSPRGAARLMLLWLAGVLLIFLLTPTLTRMHRHRLRTMAGVEIPPQRKWRGLLTRRGITAVVRSESTWRQLFYHLLIAPVLAAAAIIAVAMWPGSIATTVAFAIEWSRHAGGSYAGQDDVKQSVAVSLTFVGVVGLFVAPWLTSGLRALDIKAAKALLGPSRADELEHRVEQLTETRAGVVDAADAERRRLERDLHDGTQQRLVSLAINLGMARAQAETEEDAKKAIAEAHEEAKAALAELRDLIRGLHPAVLEDRGLDAALSGVTARMPIPVRLTVDLPRRPAPVIEAVAYFVVSEGLANIVKHAQATEAAVFVQRSGDRLHVIVTDDGVGGADASRGTGLAGLARRAASVDGTFDIDSPPGGPTLLTVDLPCNR